MSLVDLIQYIKSKTYHRCERHEMYFEEYNERERHLLRYLP